LSNSSKRGLSSLESGSLPPWPILEGVDRDLQDILRLLVLCLRLFLDTRLTLSTPLRELVLAPLFHLAPKSSLSELVCVGICITGLDSLSPLDFRLAFARMSSAFTHSLHNQV
jgi:hypothetical protein